MEAARLEEEDLFRRSFRLFGSSTKKHILFNITFQGWSSGKFLIDQKQIHSME